MNNNYLYNNLNFKNTNEYNPYSIQIEEENNKKRKEHPTLESHPSKRRPSPTDLSSAFEQQISHSNQVEETALLKLEVKRLKKDVLRENAEKEEIKQMYSELSKIYARADTLLKQCLEKIKHQESARESSRTINNDALKKLERNMEEKSQTITKLETEIGDRQSKIATLERRLKKSKEERSKFTRLNQDQARKISNLETRNANLHSKLKARETANNNSHIPINQGMY